VREELERGALEWLEAVLVAIDRKGMPCGSPTPSTPPNCSG
jgi:hypothetical protein